MEKKNRELKGRRRAGKWRLSEEGRKEGEGGSIWLH